MSPLAVHEKPIDGGSQPLTVGSSPHELVEGNASAQQKIVEPALPGSPWLQMSVESLSSGVSPPVQE
jgi:hypothetical protein